MMQAQDAKRKARKGSAQIKVSNERLQIVFSFGGKRHYLSTGFSDTPANRKLAEMKARQIDLDMLSNNFDSTLAKYKPQPTPTPITPIPPIQWHNLHWMNCGSNILSSSAQASRQIH